MANVKHTGIITVDLIAQIGKFLNADQFMGAISKKFASLELPSQLITPDIRLDTEQAIGKISSQIREVNTAISRIFAGHTKGLEQKFLDALDPLTKFAQERGYGENLKAAKKDPDYAEYRRAELTHLRTLQHTMDQMQGYLRTVPRTREDYKKLQKTASAETLKAADVIARGDRFKHPVTGRLVTPSRANIDELFGPGTRANLENLLATAEVQQKSLSEMATQLRRTRGVSRKGYEYETKGAEGETKKKRVSPVVPKEGVLIPELEVAAKQLKRVTTALNKALDPTQVAARQRADDKYQKQEDRARRLAELRSTRRILQAQGRKDIFKEGIPIDQLNTGRTKNAMLALNRRIDATNRAYESLIRKATSPEARQGFIDSQSKAVTELNKQLLAARQHLRDLSAARKAPTEKAPRTPSAAEIRRDQRRYLAGTGRDIIRQYGGRPLDVAGVSEAQLEPVIAALQDRARRRNALLANLRKRGRDDSRVFQAGARDLAETEKVLAGLQRRLRGFGTVSQQTGALFRQFFRYAVGYTVLYKVLGAVTALVGGVVKLNQSLKSIQAVTGATLEDMRSISVGIKDVALTTKFGTQEIAEAGKVLAQAGVRPEQFTNVLRSVATFAAATETSIQDAADLVSTMRNVFKELNDRTISNQLVKAINISKLTGEDLKTILSRGAQVARGYNLTAEQFLSAVSVLRNAGLKASTVATGLRQGLIELLSPDAKTLQVLQRRYAQLGEAVSGAQIEAKFFSFTQTKNPLLAVLQEFQRLGFGGENQLEFQRIFDVRAINAIQALVDNLDELEASELQIDFGDAAMEASQTQMEALANSLNNLGAAFTALGDQVGGDFVQSMDSVVDTATEAVKSLAELDAQLKVTSGSGVSGSILAGLGAGAVGAATGSGAGLIARGAQFFGGSVVGTLGGLAAREAVVGAGAGPAGAAVASGVGALISVILALDALGPLKAIARSIPTVFSNVSDTLASAADTSSKLYKPVLLFQAGMLRLFKFFEKLGATRLAAFTRFLYANPAGALVSGLIAGVTAIVLFMKKASPDNLKVQLDQALKNFDKALADREKLTEELAEYKLPEPGQNAPEGTTAATVASLQASVRGFNSQLRQAFGVAEDEVGRVREALVLLAHEGREGGSEVRRKLKDNLFALSKISFEEAGLTDAEITELAGEANSQANKVRGLQESIRNAVVRLSETTDPLTAVQQALLDSFAQLASVGDNYNKLIGAIEATPEEMANLAESWLTVTAQLAEASEDAQRSAADIAEASGQEISLIAKLITSGASVIEVKKALLQLRVSLQKLGKNTANVIEQLTEQIGKELLDVGEFNYIFKGRDRDEGAITRFYRDLTGASAEDVSALPPAEQIIVVQQRLQEELPARRQAVEELKIQLEPFQFEQPELVAAARQQLTEPEGTRARGTGPVYAEILRILQELRSAEARLAPFEGAAAAVNYIRDQAKADVAAAREKEEKGLERAQIQREDAIKIYQSPAYQRRVAQGGVPPDVLENVRRFAEGQAQFREREETIFGKTFKFIEPSAEEEEAIKHLRDFRSSQYRDTLSKKVVVPKELQEEIKKLEIRVKEAEKYDRDKLPALREELSRARVQKQQILIYENLKREAAALRYEVGDKDGGREEAAKYQQAAAKARLDKLAEEAEAKEAITVAEKRILDNRLSNEERRTFLEEQYITDLKKRIDVAKVKDPGLLTLETMVNPMVELAAVETNAINRRIVAARERERSDLFHQDEREAAARDVADLVLEKERIESTLQTELVENKKKYVKKTEAFQLQLLRRRQKQLDQELEFAFDSGQYAQIDDIQSARLKNLLLLRDAEYRAKNIAAASAEDQLLFRTTWDDTIREARSLTKYLALGNKVAQEYFAKINKVGVEFTGEGREADLAETGRRRARGTPLSRDSLVRNLEDDLDLQQKELARTERNLQKQFEELADKATNANQIGPIQAYLEAYEAGTALPTIPGFDVAETAELDAGASNLVDTKKRIEELKIALAEMREQVSILSTDFVGALDRGLDLADLTARMEQSRYSIASLGVTIQDSLVKGFEDASDAFANALVDGENFTENFRKAFADMLNQIARDIAKSAMMNLFTSFFRAGTSPAGGQNQGFFSNLLSNFGLKSGGVVETKAKGGIVGVEKKAGGGVIKGPGTGTSDSIQGVVVDDKGKVKRGIRVSDGESILTKKTTNVFGSKFISYVNSSVENAKRVAYAVKAAATGRQEKRATGGTVGSSYSKGLMDQLVSAVANGRQVEFVQGLSDRERQILLKESAVSSTQQATMVKELLTAVVAPTERKAAGGKVGVGGIATGGGTGTSDSLRAGIVTPAGTLRGILALSEGEGVLTAKSTKVLGEKFVHLANKDPHALAEALMSSSAKPLKMATGGVIGDPSKVINNTTSNSRTDSKAVDYNFTAKVNIADEGGNVSIDTLRRLDRGITQKIQDYVQGQMRPGGMLASARR